MNKIQAFKNEAVTIDIPDAIGYAIGTTTFQVILSDKVAHVYPINFDRLEITVIEEEREELPDNVRTLH